MRFLQNLFSYWANLVLVEGLANSRTFQKIAITTDQTLKELAKKAKEGSISPGEVGSKASTFTKSFKEHLGKAMREEEMKRRKF
jgi:hypothetical protein